MSPIVSPPVCVKSDGGGAVPSECQCQAVESLETRVLITRAVSSLDFSTSPYGRPGFGDRLLGFVSVSAAL